MSYIYMTMKRELVLWALGLVLVVALMSVYQYRFGLASLVASGSVTAQECKQIHINRWNEAYASADRLYTEEVARGETQETARQRLRSRLARIQLILENGLENCGE